MVTRQNHGGYESINLDKVSNQIIMMNIYEILITYYAAHFQPFCLGSDQFRLDKLSHMNCMPYLPLPKFTHSSIHGFKSCQLH